MVKIAVIQIGNSDDKLTQLEWCGYCTKVAAIVNDLANQIHFSGGPANNAPWQNWCWVIAIHENNLVSLRDELLKVREKFRQDSVALIIGGGLPELI
jgi:hypothetical protein